MFTIPAARSPQPAARSPQPAARSPQPAARSSGRSWALALLLVLCGTIFLGGSDVAMPAVAVPTIRAGLGLTTGTAAW